MRMAPPTKAPTIGPAIQAELLCVNAGLDDWDMVVDWKEVGED